MTRALELPTTPTLTDRLTTLHTRVMLDTVLLKECQRAERFEHWLSLLLIDLDHLSDLNRTRGDGVGDQVLERMGVLITEVLPAAGLGCALQRERRRRAPAGNRARGCGDAREPDADDARRALDCGR